MRLGLILALFLAPKVFAAVQRYSNDESDFEHRIHAGDVTFNRNGWNITDLAEVSAIWEEQGAKLKSAMEAVMKPLFPMLIRAAAEAEVSTECQGALLKMVLSLRQLKLWAVQMLDASGKIPNGVMSGTTFSFGNYDQCLEIQVGDHTASGFRGQYCVVELAAPNLPRPTYNKSKIIPDEESILNFFFEQAYWIQLIGSRMGICVPSLCSEENIGKMAKNALSGLNGQIRKVRCEVLESYQFNAAQQTVLGLFAAIALFVCCGTTLEITGFDSRSTNKILDVIANFLLLFALGRNTRKLMRRPRKTAGNISCLYGIRVISCLWIIMGHVYFVVFVEDYVKFSSLKNLQNTFGSLFFTFVENFSIPVDTFFFITTTPAYAAAIGLFILAPAFGSGPMWKDIWEREGKNCENSWWINLLYANNYRQLVSQCMLHTWFQALNFQLYIIGIPLVVFVARCPKAAATTLLTLSCMGMLATGVITYVLNLPPAMLMMTAEWEKAKEWLHTVYYQIYTHFGPFAIGLLSGIILVKDAVPRFSKRGLFMGWILAIMAILVSILSVYPFRAGFFLDSYYIAIYAATHRFIWTLGIAWIVLACATQQGGVVNSILSSSWWSPLSQLSYLMFLVHPLPMYIHFALSRESAQFDHYYMMVYFFGMSVLATLIAYVLYVTVELPCSAMERLLRRSPKPMSNTPLHFIAPKTSTNPLHYINGNGLNSKERENMIGSIIVTESTISPVDEPEDYVKRYKF